MGGGGALNRAGALTRAGALNRGNTVYYFLRDQNSQHFNEDLLAVNASAFSFVLCFKAIDYSDASNYLIPRLRNHNATDDDNVDFRSFRKILYSKHEKLMQCSGFVGS